MNGLRLRVYIDHELKQELELLTAVDIGRGDENTLVLEDETVSTRHGRVEPADGRWRYTDVGSANGSQIAGGPLLGADASAPIEDLTQIMIGSTVLELEPATDLEVPEPELELDVDPEPVATARLVVLGDGDPHVHELDEQQILLGRGDDCDVRLDLASVSQRHAELRPTPRGWVLRDLGSTNGTRVGIVPVSGERLLHSGSHLILGEADLYFVEGDEVDGGEDFAAWLAKKHQLGNKQAKVAVKTARETGRSLDEVLLASGAVGPGKLTELRRQAANEAEREATDPEGLRSKLFMLAGVLVTFGLLAWLAWS